MRLCCARGVLRLLCGALVLSRVLSVCGACVGVGVSSVCAGVCAGVSCTRVSLGGLSALVASSPGWGLRLGLPPVRWLVPRRSWLRSLGVVSRHFRPSFAAGGGVGPPPFLAEGLGCLSPPLLAGVRFLVVVGGFAGVGPGVVFCVCSWCVACAFTLSGVCGGVLGPSCSLGGSSRRVKICQNVPVSTTQKK